LPAQRGLVPVVADLTDVASVRRALGRLPRLDAAVMYAPLADQVVHQMLCAAVDGPIVELLTSRWADPSRGDVALDDLSSGGTALLLGWSRLPSGASRWHSPTEISDAALEVLSTGRPRQLGAVRPWSDRPG
jgi:hypothetical protein